MKAVLVLDLETSGLDPATHQIIELGHVLWSVEHRTILECYSSLLAAESNGAERFNGIPEAVLSEADDPYIAWEITAQAAARADCVLAHSAQFDRGFAEAARMSYEAVERVLGLPWICTMEDALWPQTPASRSLVSIALAHGVAVTSAHRAINDCLLLARLLERMGDDVEPFLEIALGRSLRPKKEFIARTPYEQKDEVKAAGFHWNGTVWSRYMAVEDADQLPFAVVPVDRAIREARA
jgi:DNA polymerase-3 subunit epsilon